MENTRVLLVRRSESNPKAHNSVCIVSIVRLMKLLQTENHPSPDFSYDSADLVYFTSIEVQGAIVCACAITLKPLLNQWMPQWFSVLRRDNSLGQDPFPLTIGQRASRRKLSKIDQQTSGHDSWTVDRPSKDLESGSVGDPGVGGFLSLGPEFDSPEQGKLGDDIPFVRLSDLPPEIRSHAAAGRDITRSMPPPPPVRTSSLSAFHGLAVGAFLDDSSLRRQKRSSESGHQRSLTSPDFYDSSSERLDWDLERTTSDGSTPWRG